MAIRGLDARIGVLRAYINRLPEGTNQNLTLYDMAKALDVSWQCLKGWADNGYVRAWQTTEREGRSPIHSFDVRGVLADLERCQRGEIPEPEKPVPEPEEIRYESSAENTKKVADALNDESFFDRVRQAALRAAKEAYRDEILEAADLAKRHGKKDLAIRLFEDFIHMEEALKVHYEKK